MPATGYFDEIFGIDGDLTNVPDPIQGDGSVSYQQGYGILYSTPVGSGGLNIARAQMNQLFFDITSALQQYQQNGIPPFITSSMNGGSPFSYGVGATVLFGGIAYQSMVNSNTDTPPSSKWRIFNGRFLLAGTQNFYVASTGNDANLGTIGSPWLTQQHAANYILSNIDLAGFGVLVNVSDGTYTTGANLSAPFTGGGSVSFIGDPTIPDNCIINTTSGNAFAAVSGAAFNISGFKITTTTAGKAAYAWLGGQISITGNMDFGACAEEHMYAQDGGNIIINTTAYTVSGGALNHLLADGNGIANAGGGLTVTLSGTPAFSVAFCQASNSGSIFTGGNTYSGSATGKRYSALANGVINTQGSGTTYLPGSISGTTATGGEYV